MWIFRPLPGKPGQYKVGFLEMYWETETLQAQRFCDPYDKEFSQSEAEAKVHYLNGGAAGAIFAGFAAR